MIIPRLESGENLFEVLREKFNVLADAVEQLDKLASASPLLDVLDTDALAIYCAKLARRDDLQAQYLAWRDRYDEDPVNATLKVMIGLSDSLQSVERDVLSYANKLGLTPESRARLAKRLAEQDEDDPDGDLFA